MVFESSTEHKLMEKRKDNIHVKGHCRSKNVEAKMRMRKGVRDTRTHLEGSSEGRGWLKKDLEYLSVILKN